MNNSKYKKYIIYVVMTVCVLNMFIGATVVNTNKTINISTERKKIGTMEYKDFYIDVKKVEVEGDSTVAYCLDVDKDYPKGEEFKLKGNCSEEISNIIAAGYPNKTPKELNLENENEAYLATQIAIWSKIEGYNLDKVQGVSSKILNVTKKILKESKNSITKIENKVYKTNNKSIQDVIVIFEKEDTPENPEEKPDVKPEEPDVKPEEPDVKPEEPDVKPEEKPGVTEDEAEKEQPEYPPQEG